MKLLNNNLVGLSLLHILPALTIMAAIVFVGENVYQTKQRKQDFTSKSTIGLNSTNPSEINTVQEEEISQDETAQAPIKTTDAEAEYPTPTTSIVKAPAPGISKPKTAYTIVDIAAVAVATEGDNVKITATLPGSYSGTCNAKVKTLPNYDKYQYASASFSNSNTCTVTFSKTTLAADGTNWRAFMDFRNNESTVKGYHSGQDFSL